METRKLLRDATAEEVAAHFDAIDEAARLRAELVAMRRKAVSLAQEIARREAELDVDIEIRHNEFGRYGEIVLGGAIVGR